MARFLDDRHVGRTIREVVAGEDVRCAVAFWGDGALKALFGSGKRAQKARIICDLTMGGTNPDELRQLGAPDNLSLRHVKGLHAKLYLSTAGLVVASANASNRGIGFVDVPALTECGTFHRIGTRESLDAASWFERLWRESHQVDADALEDARRAWVRRPHHGNPVNGTAVPGGSLLHRIAADPDTFRGIGVAFTTGEANSKDVEEASGVAIAADDKGPERKFSNADRALLRSWRPGNLFTDWSRAETSAWPAMFLCVHRGSRGGLGYWAYERFADAHVGPDEWSVFGLPSRATRKRLGITAKPRSAAALDAELIGSIFEVLDSDAESDGCVRHRLCESPLHLARLLERVGQPV